jgi:hypothetical protein
MPLALYDERLAHIRATSSTEVDGFRAEAQRLLEIERLWTEATGAATDATARPERAETEAAQARQTIADLERANREPTERAEQAERGMPSVQLWKTNQERFETLALERLRPEPKSNGASKRAPKATPTKG